MKNTTKGIDMKTKEEIKELEKIYTLVDDLEISLYKRGKKDSDFTKKVAAFVDAVDDELSFLEALDQKEERAAAQAIRIKRIQQRRY
mgnify:CR=1 FL=1|tara:strand:+ start:51 stop:311 length:261 start_codon:yes stop_codon:yes gene_type:complete